MTLMYVFGWLMGGASLLYFLVALAKPDWFLALPVKSDESKGVTHKEQSHYDMAHNFPG